MMSDNHNHNVISYNHKYNVLSASLNISFLFTNVLPFSFFYLNRNLCGFIPGQLNGGPHYCWTIRCSTLIKYPQNSETYLRGKTSA